MDRTWTWIDYLLTTDYPIDHRHTRDRPWADHRKIMLRPWPAHSRVARPWTDHKQTN